MEKCHTIFYNLQDSLWVKLHFKITFFAGIIEMGVGTLDTVLSNVRLFAIPSLLNAQSAS